jgi:TolB protein
MSAARVSVVVPLAVVLACGGERKAAPAPPPSAVAVDAAAMVAPPSDAASPVDAGLDLGFVRGEVITVGQVDGHQRPLVLDPTTATWRAVGGGDDDLFPTGHRLRGAILCIAAHGHDEHDHLEQFALVRGATVERFGPTAQLVRNPTLAPDGGLVFEANLASFRDLFALDRRGKLRRLTDHPAGNFEPALSPDGRTVAFASSRDGNAELYLQPLAGGAPTRLTDERRDDWGPAWSPDGARLAFLSDRDGRERVYLMAADGTGAARVTSHRDNGGEAEPRWSPDGSRLALLRGFGADLVIDVVEVATGAVRTVTPTGSNDVAYAWSPDGGHLAVARRVGRARRLAFVRVSDGLEVAAVASDSELVRWLPAP